CDVAGERRKQPLGAELLEGCGVGWVNIPKILGCGLTGPCVRGRSANLKTRTLGSEDHTARTRSIEEVCRYVIGRGRSSGHSIPIDLAPDTAERAVGSSHSSAPDISPKLISRCRNRRGIRTRCRTLKNNGCRDVVVYYFEGCCIRTAESDTRSGWIRER